MKKIPDNVFNKIESLAKEVITNLKKKGHIVPVKQQDGSVRFEKFVVRKNKNGFYSVYGRSIVYADNINLPQTAAILASNLALGKILDADIIKLDKEYGYRLFDEQVFLNATKRKKISLDQEIFYETRSSIAKLQKDEIKGRILQSFKKLSNMT
jgi:hypothetical protein